MMLILSFSANAQFSPELSGNIVVSFNGVNCGSCSTKVEESFKGVEGVLAVIVDAPQKKIYISLDENKTLSESFIKEEIVKFGYIFLTATSGYDE